MGQVVKVCSLKCDFILCLSAEGEVSDSKAANMHSSQRLDSLPKDDIWTPELEHDFYTSISQLIRQKTKQPRKPESYSPDTIRIKDEYLLPLEEELCFADQVAFLASCKEGVAYVSAATVQERERCHRLF